MKKIYKYILFSLVVVLSAFLLSGCTVSDEKISKYNQIISDADLLLEAKEYTLAVEKLSEASELIPSKIDAVERLVDIFVIKNRLEDATKLVDDSGVKLKDSERSFLYSKVGDASYRVKDFERASYNYQLAKELGDTDSKGSLGVAKVSIQKGNIQQAKNLLTGKLSKESEIESTLLLSYIYSLSDTEKSIKVLKEVESGDEWRDSYSRWRDVLNSLSDDTLFNSAKLARAYIQEGYPALAVALLEPQKEEMEEYIDGLYLLGKAYYEQREYERSISLLKGITAVTDLNQYIYWVLARNYYLQDNLEESFSYYDSAISYSGQEGEEQLYKEYIDILIEHNRLEKVLEVVKRAEKFFDEMWIYIDFMEVYFLRRDYEKFVFYMERIEYESLADTLKAEYLFLRGEYLIQISDIVSTKGVLDLFWELDEYDPRYNLLYAELSFQEGNLEDTRIYCKKAIEYDILRIVTEQAEKLLAQVD